MVRVFVSALVMALVVFVEVSAQGVQTGSVRGNVQDASSLGLPNATVRAESPAQQGSRITETDTAGAYRLSGLAPGVYTFTFEFPGLQSVVREVRVSLGATEIVDVAMQTVVGSDALVVVGQAPRSHSGGINLQQSDIDALPTGRTPSLVAELAPGLTNNTPNVNQVTISGAVAYDNVFLLDGVDIGDNLFARPDDLFVEEAIEETQVLTSAVSAEYGRFSGGVVNAVTKRGGNLFSGSVRSNLSNAAWTDETPFEKAAGQKRQSKMDRYYEGTFGGPLRKDRAWFFFAGRTQSSETSLTLAQTAAPFQQTDDQHALGSEGHGHADDQSDGAGAVSRIAARSGSRRRCRSRSIRRRAISTNTPGNLFVANWNGVMANRFFATAQYSRKTNHPRFGNTSTRLQDSPFLTIGRVSPGGLHFGAGLLRSHRSGRSRQQPADRQRVVFRIASGLGHARRQGRRRSVLAGAARRQLAVVHRLPVQHRLRQPRTAGR